ncbi:DsbC family protein [Chitiniphilus purpureus]|uniref:Thiol:disulfide interchange protein n=1 Tax=Chitiniphilus purpureus TaxID=2981137 RepID=A0ABY6DQR6_9NEIS|nr:DsbC family protein [Chitiniphilus sp. CD1]UXY16657.1 DsbC family protein [Chitiniphilus sp. CD1]
MLQAPSRLIRTAIATGMIALTACSASAGPAKEPKAAQALRAKLEKSLDGRTITSVSATPLQGIYEVVLGGRQIVYTDAKGDYVLVGDLVDVVNKKSLTEARVAELMSTDFSKLPLDKAVKEVRGDGSRKLAVFSDPDCPFCKRLERESLAGVDNVTIYTFLFPLSIHPDAGRKSALIWCAEDRAAAWKNWVLNEKLPENGSTDCANPIQDNLALGEQLGITGTPALIFANGRIVSGAIPKAQLEELLTLSGSKKQ